MKRLCRAVVTALAILPAVGPRTSRAQPPAVGDLPPLPPPSVAPRPRPTREVGLRQNADRIGAQTPPAEGLPPLPAPAMDLPPLPPPAAGSAPEPGDAGETASNTDLSLPASEREGLGGEPTEEAEAEEAAAPAKDPTRLLMNALGLDESPVKVYGWIENSFTGNTNGTPRSRINFGVNPNSLANSWMGNQYYLIVENPLEQGDEVNFGFRVDNLFGNDWQWNHSHGMYDTVAKLNHFNGYDTAQLYGEVHVPPILSKAGTDIKGGRFYTILGYEVVPATGRPLLSVPYMFSYGQPFTHVGALATTHVTDRVNWYNGVINGWDRWVNDTYKWGYLGGLTWTSRSGKTNLSIAYTFGPNQYPRFLPTNTVVAPAGFTAPGYLPGRRNLLYGGSWRTMFTTVLTHKWTETLTQVLETDQGFEPNVPGFGPGGTPNDSSWYGFGNWFLWQCCKVKDGCDEKAPERDLVTAVWRSEVFRDNNGVRTGFADNFYEMTLGLIIKPKPYLWVRPEARYDWAQFTHPYNDGTRNSQFTLAVDAILLY